jgi:hypothetical protein
MAAGPSDAPPGPAGLARRFIEWWAVLGGVVLLGVADKGVEFSGGGAFLVARGAHLVSKRGEGGAIGFGGRSGGG